MMNANQTSQDRTREALKVELEFAARRFKLPALKSAERAAYKLYELARDQAAANPELAAWHELCVAQWQAFYQEVKRRNIRRAELKDKGEVLFTCFVPGNGSHVREITRTPHRRIATYWWRRTWPVVTLEPGAPDVEAFPFDDPLREFARLQVKREAVAA